MVRAKGHASGNECSGKEFFVVEMTTKRLMLIVAMAAAVVAVAVAVPVTSGANGSSAVSPALAGATSAASAGKALPTIRGQVSPGDTVQTGRLFRDGVPSDCSITRTNPGLGGDPSARRAGAYLFTNPKNKAQCVTVTLQTACGQFASAASNGFPTAYGDPGYNPSDPSQNWIGDAGQSGTPMQFSFIAGPFANFEVVVATVDFDLLNCNAYTLDVAFGTAAPKVTTAVPKPAAVDHR